MYKLYAIKCTLLYNRPMEVPISQFRKNLFTLVDQALGGKEVWVRHKGRRVRIVPEGPPPDKLARITPMRILNPPDFDLNDPRFKKKMLEEMQKEGEKDWEEI